jgi:hypothetical protein
MSVFVLNMTTMIAGRGTTTLLVVTRFRKSCARGWRQIAAVNALAPRAAPSSPGLTPVVVGFGALLLTPLIETRARHRRPTVVAVAVSLHHPAPPPVCDPRREIDRPAWLARRLARYHAPGVWEKWARTLSRTRSAP